VKAVEGDGDGKKEDGFDIEDEKDDGVEVIAGLELDPGVSGGFEAALVDGVLAWAGFLWGELLCPEPCEQKGSYSKGFARAVVTVGTGWCERVKDGRSLSRTITHPLLHKGWATRVGDFPRQTVKLSDMGHPAMGAGGDGTKVAAKSRL